MIVFYSKISISKCRILSISWVL